MSTAAPNHRRVKPGGKTELCPEEMNIAIKPGAASSGVTGPSSQIPGLSQTTIQSPTAERISGRRVGIFESDSDYVKLAKQGGHKGLLSHDVEDDKPMTPYNPSNFFGDELKNGSQATSPDSQMKGGRQLLAAPFGTDNDVSWEKEPDRVSHGKEKISPDGAAKEMEALSMAHNYKRTSYDKKAPPVSMSKLLSHGYVEVKKSPDDDTSSIHCLSPHS